MTALAAFFLGARDAFTSFFTVLCVGSGSAGVFAAKN
jgi:hypothetical protein